MTFKQKYAAVVAILVIGVGGYFLFYVPYENQIIYQQNVECTALVAKSEASSEASIARLLGDLNGWLFYPSQSHFNQRLNTCLGYFSNSDTIMLKGSADQMYFSKSIMDVVGNKTIVTSETEMVLSTTTLIGGVSTDDFAQQEAALMSE
jgi:hypothetical protein